MANVFLRTVTNWRGRGRIKNWEVKEEFFEGFFKVEWHYLQCYLKQMVWFGTLRFKYLEISQTISISY